MRAVREQLLPPGGSFCWLVLAYGTKWLTKGEVGELGGVAGVLVLGGVLGKDYLARQSQRV